MLKKIRLVFAFIVFFLFYGCGDGFYDFFQDCSKYGKNESLYTLMKDWYLWYDEMPYVDDFSKYRSLDDLIEKVKSPKDRWSFTLSKEEYNSFLNSKEEDFGLELVQFKNKKGAFVKYVKNNSSAHKNGLKRGDLILSVDGVEVEEKNKNQISQKFYTEDELKIIYYNNHEKKEVKLKKENYTSSTILYSSVIDEGNLKIGYFVFNSFNENSVKELRETFKQFSQNGVNKIIIDLRYNHGGIINVIPHLGHMLKNTISGKKAFVLRYNDKHKSSNQIYRFTQNESDDFFDLEEIVFLTTKESSSASEVLISSLKPFVKTYIIGDDTSGKPVGMDIHKICDRYAFVIMFRTYNSQNYSFSFNGIKADCYVNDDFKFNFGNKNEPMLKAGILYLQSGICNGNLDKIRSKENIIEFSKYNKFKNMVMVK